MSRSLFLTVARLVVLVPPLLLVDVDGVISLFGFDPASPPEPP